MLSWKLVKFKSNGPTYTWLFLHRSSNAISCEKITTESKTPPCKQPNSQSVNWFCAFFFSINTRVSQGLRLFPAALPHKSIWETFAVLAVKMKQEISIACKQHSCLVVWTENWLKNGWKEIYSTPISGSKDRKNIKRIRKYWVCTNT